MAIGANMGFRRPVFDALGGFDESFLIQYDDADFCYRAHRRGFTIQFVPHALVAYRLRSDPRSAARRSAQYTFATAQFRAKHGIHQPWQSKVLRGLHHCRVVLSISRCRTPLGRWEYRQDLGLAIGALRGFIRYGIVG
jgi:GT2 family glycosyltransferase